MHIIALWAFFVTVTGAAAPAAARAPRAVTLSIVGTSDLHGHIGALPWLSGYVKNLRAARARDGGAVVVLDAGDMFQGTLESNLEEGASVVRAYNAIGYAAAAIGNHELDFGPVGPAPSPVAPGDDPRGALKARAAEAHFPFLAANIVERKGETKNRKPVDWPNVLPSTIVRAAGLEIGIVGVVTTATGGSALPANVAGLEFLPLDTTIAAEARKLRARGAQVVVAVAHAGGACTDLTDPDRLDSCDPRSEIFTVARRLPKGLVDAIVAGHTHQAVAQRVAGIPIIQSYANGRAFGRVDLTLALAADRKHGRVTAAHLDPPREICPGTAVAKCAPGDYEGAPVTADETIVELNRPSLSLARRKGDERLGVEVPRPLPHRRGEETALGNLLADLMLAARPGNHAGSAEPARAKAREPASGSAAIPLAMLNGGGMRAGLPPGPLTYGGLYETFPFDNAFASLRLSAGKFRALLARSFAHAGSLVALSGVRALGRCQHDRLDVILTRESGTPIPDEEILSITTTDYLATGGDGFFAGTDINAEIGVPMRDAMADVLRARGGTLDPDRLFDPKNRRIDLPSPLPVKCGQ
jgi:2',3'-cyclic-nucleotide 2'-phosphodiesterase (5'-nucleotidase family)